MSRARAIWRASACALYLLLLSQARAGVRAEASTAQIADNVVTLEAPSPPVNATEGKKESIAKILDDALKEEFKREGEAQAEQGHHFNETSKLSEAREG
ncbi:hypothetical protein H632_c2067p1 [Helicosporidium sp. ATCC 50920]|nr:hypothetical protein H632_c2067p1 [Helicosporidium sp. ATCC 50920]|eukprot:KDD73545.1 hypothetical protein H632_c2067p1 [Helicosporidium sp. ATCC 50920]